MTSIFGKYIKGSITLKYKPFSSLGTWGKTLSYPYGQTMPRPQKKKTKTGPAESRHNIALPLQFHLFTCRVEFLFKSFQKYPSSLFHKITWLSI